MAILEFFQRGDPINLVFTKLENYTLHFGLLLDELRLEIMSDDHLVTNLAFLDYRKSLFGQVAILEFFQRGSL